MAQFCEIFPSAKFFHPISSCAATEDWQTWSAWASKDIIGMCSIRLSVMQWWIEGWVSTSINCTSRFVTLFIHSWFAPLPSHKMTCSMVLLSCWHQGHLLWPQNLHVNCILLMPQKWLMCLPAQRWNISGKPTIARATTSQLTKSKPAVDIWKWFRCKRKVCMVSYWIHCIIWLVGVWGTFDVIYPATPTFELNSSWDHKVITSCMKQSCKWFLKSWWVQLVAKWLLKSYMWKMVT